MHIKLYLGQNEDCSPGDGISVSSGRLLQGGRRGSHAIYKFVTKGAGNLNIKIRYQVKEFSILCMGRCKPLGSLNTFLSYAPQLSGAKSYFFVHLKEWQMVAPCIPQLLSNHHGGWQHLLDGSFGKVHKHLRPEINDGCDISCLLI